MLHSGNRAVRKAAFHAVLFAQFDAHKNTIAASVATRSVQKDVYYAKARKHPVGPRGIALFHDNVPSSVYENLVASRPSQPAGRPPSTYDLRRRAMKLQTRLHAYDTYVPILSDLEKRTLVGAGDQGVRRFALAPLGDAYCRDAPGAGLTTARWCDRYPNRGKQSGAFS